MINYKTKRSLVILLIIIAIAGVITVAWCSNKAKLKKAFLKAFNGSGKIVFRSISSAGEWALIKYTNKMKTGDSFSGSALMRKSGNKWHIKSYSGMGPTSDFLRDAGVPKDLWSKLINKNWIDKTNPIVIAIHNKMSNRYIVRSVRIAEPWALCEWSLIADGEVQAEGQALLVFRNGRWIVVESGGGVMGASILKEKGVPSNLTKKLLGR